PPVAVDDTDHHLAHGQGDDQRVEVYATDQEAVHQPDEGGDTDGGEDGDPDPVVGALPDSHHDGGGEGHGPRRGQVDAPGHDDEHLAEGGDTQEGAVGGDGAKRHAAQGLRRLDRRYPDQEEQGEVDGDVAGGDDERADR